MRQQIKKYCLLEDGSIHTTHYGNGEMKNIYKEGRYWYLDHDVFGRGIIAYMHHRIIKFADTVEELKDE